MRTLKGRCLDSITVLAILIAFILAGGCATVLKKPSTIPGPWKIKEKIEFSKLRIDDCRVEVVGKDKARISGRVVECAYMLKRSRERRRCVHGALAAYHWETDWERLPDVWKSWSPAYVLVSLSYARTVRAKVEPTGQFSAVISPMEGNFLGTPQPHRNRYFGIKTKQSELEVTTVGYPAGVDPDIEGYLNIRAEWSMKATDYWFYITHWDRVKSFVRREAEKTVSVVYIDVKDKITHIPVAPVIRVTGSQVRSPQDVKQSLKDHFVREFQDAKIVGKAMEFIPSHVWRYLAQDRKLERSGQAIDFQGLVGATYKVETMHPEYFFFRGFLRVDPGNTSKRIVLVEKGDKVRMENVKEGQGGQMIDID